MKHLSIIIFLLLSFFIQYSLAGQEKCGVMYMGANAHFVADSTQEVFEKWIRQKILEKRNEVSNQRSTNEVLIIPVVVHIIHKGENLGAGSNIPTEQVLSQIEVLNQDFRRQNADANQTFDPFLPVAADVEINFQLAVRDPEGLPTTGIVRTQGTKNSYNTNDTNELSRISSWPADDYFNIWVTDFGSNLLGFAQFPVSNLAGMNVDRVSNPNTDGIYSNYRYFGVGFNADDFSRGRTVTHEVGHYLGLRHVWGDGGCNADDFCQDTPPQERSTRGCPTEPSFSCGSFDMNQNFMDYTDDACMNIFTICQKERMRAVLENSPRRFSLLQSEALNPAVVADFDIGLRAMAQLYDAQCSQEITPELEIRNYGNERIRQLTIRWSINGAVIEDVMMENLNLAFGEITTLNFSPFQLNENGSFLLEFEILQVNGRNDDNPNNDKIAETANYAREVTGTFFTDFEAPPTQWFFENNEVMGIVNAPSSNANNQAFSFQFFNSEQTLGELNQLESSVIKVSPLAEPRLEFRYAYDHPTDNFAEGLFVRVSTDCGMTFPRENTVFSSYSSGLNTTSRQVNGSFVPENDQEWRSAFVNLSRFRNAGQIKILFEAQNGLGNNLYIDDILVETGPNPDFDLALNNVTGFSPVICDHTYTAQLSVSNNGNFTVSNYSISYQINNQAPVVLPLITTPLESFEVVTIPVTVENLPANQLSTIVFFVTINNQIDEIPTNNQKVTYVYQDASEIDIPYRNVPATQDWFVYHDEGVNKWDFTEAYHIAQLENNPDLGDRYWLVSPLINIANDRQVSLSFDVAYANRSRRNDLLRVLLDKDCAGTFNRTIFQKSGAQLSTATHENNWQPETEEDWRNEFITLDNLSDAEQIRFAFQAVNQNGSNIFIRNVALVNNATPIVSTEKPLLIYPNPTKDVIQVQFNLPETTNIQLRLIDMMGRIIFEGKMERILNQTISLFTASEKNGLYLLRVEGANFKYVEKVIVRH